MIKFKIHHPMMNLFPFFSGTENLPRSVETCLETSIEGSFGTPQQVMESSLEDVTWMKRSNTNKSAVVMYEVIKDSSYF